SEPLVDDGSALFPHELRDVVHGESGLPGRATALPATERLDPWPGTGRGAGRQAEHVVVRERDRLVERVDGGDRGERREQLVAEESMRCRQVADDGRLDIEAAREV